MGAIASLGQSALSVEPGQQVSTTLRVRNAGAVVDQFTFEPLGEGAGWITVEPQVLRLLPNVEEEVRVTFAPPRSAQAAAGQVPFAVRVLSQEDPAGSAVEEGVVDVGAFVAVTAELIPRMARGRRGARQQLAVDNRGNERLNSQVMVFDDNEALNFDLADPTIVAEPGHAMFTSLKITPRKRFWRGPDRTVPFQLQLQAAEGQPPVAVDGTLLQQAMLPKWLPKAILAALLLLLLLAALWFALLRPAIESAAREGVAEELADQQQATAALQEAVTDVQEQMAADLVAAGTEGEEELLGGSGENEEVTEEVVEEEEPPVVAEGPVEVRVGRDARLAASRNSPGGWTNSGSTITVPADERFLISDIILQNPSGAPGLVQIRRDGDVLLEVALQNFRDLDYHFVAPLVVTNSAGINLRIFCNTDPGEGCSASALFSGEMVSMQDPDDA